MNEQNRILDTRALQLPAAIDYFLRTPLHFRIATLHRIEIERLGIGAGVHAGSRSATQSNQHTGTTQLNQQCPRRECLFAHMYISDLSHSASQHDGFVIPTHLATHLFFESTEIASQIGAPKLIIECGAADWSFEHDL